MKKEVNPLAKIISIIIAVVSIILTFTKWLSVPYFGAAASMLGVRSSVSGSFSLLQISDFFRMVTRLDSDEAAIISIIFALAVIVMVAFGVLFIMCALVNGKAASWMCTFSMLVNVFVSVAFLIMVMLVNEGIRQESYNVVSNIVSATAVPYIVIVLSLVQRVCMSVKVKENAPNYANVYNMQNPGPAFYGESAPVNSNKSCPVCNANNNSDAKFCQSCGANFEALNNAMGEENAKKCANCDAPILDGMVFCTNCGTAVNNNQE